MSERLKTIFRKIAGIKTEEELKLEESKSAIQKTKEFFRSLFFAAIAALIIISFVIQNTRIPTGSMETTIQVGDFVLVNKFIYGSSSPKYIPFTEIELQYFSFPSVREPERGDIVVFEFPGNRDEIVPDELNVNYVKRLIGMPGDLLEVRDKVVFINGKENWIPPHIQYLSPYPVPADRTNPRIFPIGKPWNEDNYGPLRIPKKGDVIQLNTENILEWKTFINREYLKDVVSISNGKIFIEGKEVTSYIIKKDYYFMMGDNRDDSLDSRFWGFVPRDYVVGQAFMVLFSWDRDIPFSQPIKLLGSIRFDRVLKLID